MRRLQGRVHAGGPALLLSADDQRLASRYLLACEALHTTKEAYAFTVFERVFKEFGLSGTIRTDNGVPFASPNALFNRSRLTPLRAKSLFSSASSVSSLGRGQLNPPQMMHRLRAIPSTTAISRELVPLPANRSICLNCLMVSLLFAGIKISPFVARYLIPKLLTQGDIFSAENWPAFGWNGGRLHIGMVAETKTIVTVEP